MIVPSLAVFAGGTSAEREVSLGSGRACALGLTRSFPTRLVDLGADAVPPDFDPAREIVFSTLHGTFGEDGGMQALLDQVGAHYAGSGAAASALTMDKTRTKEIVAALGIPVAEGISFAADAKPTLAEVAERVGRRVVVKPNAEGSSVGLTLVEDPAGLAAAFNHITTGLWLVERRLEGRELSVGILGGRAMGVVEIRPKSGVYDFASKYTKGLTDYFAPAPLDPATTERVQNAAAVSFAACGCRDYARVDFILSRENEPFLLEINTLPGMKETSLLPMSARCVGLDFESLVREMVTPAVQRFQAAVPCRRS